MCDVTITFQTYRILLTFPHKVLNATFDNVSVILWWSVLLMEETGIPGENHRPAASH